MVVIVKEIGDMVLELLLVCYLWLCVLFMVVIVLIVSDKYNQQPPEFVDSLKCIQWNGTFSIDYIDGKNYVLKNHDEQSDVLDRDYLTISPVYDRFRSHLSDEEYFNGTWNTYWVTDIVSETNDTITVIFTQGYYNYTLIDNLDFVRSTFYGKCIKYVKTYEERVVAE